ncbi:MAG: hypothetical protein H0U88_00045 [Chthoniobacterales bacterium]|nr:hypothetical protein [Chthoniobacterales bacterium]
MLTPQAALADVQPLRVPYNGLKGDYQAIQLLTPTANGFPWLARLVGTSFSNQPSGATYTLAGGDLPYILAHFDHQSRLLRMEAINVTTGKNWGRVVDLPYLGRNSTGFFSFVWDGVTTNGSGKTSTVPNGQYVIKVSVAKELGDAANPADVETWTSPVITLARP